MIPGISGGPGGIQDGPTASSASAGNTGETAYITNQGLVFNSKDKTPNYVIAGGILAAVLIVAVIVKGKK